jgi:multicomponent Na+:H+ antiporter subunit C
MILNFDTLFLFAIIMFFVAFFGLIVSKNIVKSVISILFMQTAVIMFWMFLSARFGTVPPIVEHPEMMYSTTAFADPMPQALMLTAIIIGISVTAVNITMLNTLFRKYRSVSWTEMMEITRGEEID